MSDAAPSPRKRRPWRIALFVVAFLVVSEAGLQFVAWRVWSTEWIGPAGPPIPGTVLFVGAGETFDEGVLRRSDAWPADVERRLRDAGYEAALVNRAAPGRDSREALLRLPRQLSHERPAIVVACVGVEDFRQRRAAVVDDAELIGRNAPFPVRLRLLSLLAAPFASDAVEGEQEERPFLGTWHFGDAEFVFEPGGRFRLGQIEASWTFEGGDLQIAIPGSEPYPVEWSLEGERLVLSGPFPGGEVTVMRGPALTSTAERGADAMRRGDWDGAEWLLLPAVRGAARDGDAAATLIELLARLGRHDEARALLQELETGIDGAAAVRRTARARIAAGRFDEGVALVADDLAAHVGDRLLVASLRALPVGAASAKVAAAAEQALTGVPPAACVQLAWIAADLRARAGRHDDALRALAAGLAAHTGEVDPRDVPVVVRSASGSEWETAIAGLSPESHARVDAHLARIAEADRESAAVLAQNLGQLVDMVRFYGAEIVLLDPADDAGASVARRRIAAEKDISCVPCAATRDALVEATHAVLTDHLSH